MIGAKTNHCAVGRYIVKVGKLYPTPDMDGCSVKKKNKTLSSVPPWKLHFFFSKKIIINEHTKYRPLGETVGISLSPVSASRWFITDVWTVACIRNFPSLSLLLFPSFLFLYFYTLTLNKIKTLPLTAVNMHLQSLICRCQIIKNTVLRTILYCQTIRLNRKI